ncbi:unnamed protein product [Prorocentrum cordatum]|uniref:Calmodulin n=1 Tax=Prorocentrum cordatum TaxID=2364126 RepID=A0ABN9P8N3_9DINO|nr:unnamed protein product [Polarella glacialis]
MEDTLCQLFTRYGTVVSVVIAHEGQKIQGYVTLDARENAQRAKDALQDREVDGVPLWIEWCSGPPPTPVPRAETRDGRHVVVEPPPDQRRRRIIDRLAKYVAQEGHAFEQLVMERESPDGNLAFLFQQGSKENVYYRWRAFAFAQGDNFKIWRTETFRVCEGALLVDRFKLEKEKILEQKEAFDFLDQDHQGRITLENLRTFNAKFQNGYTDAQLREEFKALHADGDDTRSVTFLDFLRVYVRGEHGRDVHLGLAEVEGDVKDLDVAQVSRMRSDSRVHERMPSLKESPRAGGDAEA